MATIAMVTTDGEYGGEHDEDEPGGAICGLR